MKKLLITPVVILVTLLFSQTLIFGQTSGIITPYGFGQIGIYFQMEFTFDG